MQNLIKKIKTKNSTICIIGLGYVGLPLAVNFSSKGFRTVGFDNDPKKISSLKKNNLYVDTVEIKKFIGSKSKLTFTNNEEKIANSDIFIICVPTPITKNKSPDMRYLNETVKLLSKIDLKNKAIILESTTYPGTTEEIYLNILKQKKLIPGKNVFLIYSPERVDPGNPKYQIENTPKIISGYSPRCLQVAKELYKNITKVYPVSSLKTAEFTKLLENVYRSINIGFVNEMKLISEKLGIDIFESIKAASSKPFGYVPFYPGPGLGGHCIPVDPYLLSWKAKELDFNARFIELSGQINDQMPNYIVGKCIELLNRNEKKIKKSKILLLGVSYKKNSADLRESPALKIIDKLNFLQADVYFADRHVGIKDLKRKKVKKINFSKSNISKFDCLIIVTDHNYFDYNMIEKYGKLIVDCRGRLKKISKNKIRA
jgi:UDP-N-acetyl-D-glucosamine dehydrogenase